jgi:NADH:ubiquinone oxidoreductase subunit B-like Fe-S oxidoreductase
MVFSSGGVFAQGLPVNMGSHVPVAIWFAGAAVLGVVLAYGIIRTRSRTAAEKRMTEQATKDLYAREDRDAKR